MRVIKLNVRTISYIWKRETDFKAINKVIEGGVKYF